MPDTKVQHMSTAHGHSAVDPSDRSTEGETDTSEMGSHEATSHEPPSHPPLHQFLRTASTLEVARRFTDEAADVLNRFRESLGHYAVLALLDTHTYIGESDLDRIFMSLKKQNADQKKDVLLITYSRGGNIEPAYQISKICRSFAASRFVVAVPRMAKSAATIIAIGADEIHMGPLGHLGPIDPQAGDLHQLQHRA
jgi:ClpP class serine protease